MMATPKLKLRLLNQAPQEITWSENGETRSALWRSENGSPPPKRVQIADDTLTADAAYRLASEGTALLWRGDYQNARQLLQAMARRMDQRGKSKKAYVATEFPAAFHLHRQAQAQRARTLGMLIVPLNANYTIPLRRAQDIAQACAEAYGIACADTPASIVSLREILGIIGAHEWRKNGVPVNSLGGKSIHPHYGVFSPVRGEYVDLVANAPLPAAVLNDGTAIDIGVGSGILSAVLAQRGIKNIIATDQDPRALACSTENIQQLGFTQQVSIVEANLFPDSKADLIVCNPPWLPAKANAAIEYALYDQDSQMLRGFLTGLAKHLNDNGEGWLIISDLAEHLKLRSRETLLGWIEAAGLKVIGRIDTRPKHGKVFDREDLLFNARSKEITSLWRLGKIRLSAKPFDQ
jgi:methylase of polypeptide subunit release factors